MVCDERRAKDCARSWTFQHKFWHICQLLFLKFVSLRNHFFYQLWPELLFWVNGGQIASLKKKFIMKEGGGMPWFSKLMTIHSPGLAELWNKIVFVLKQCTCLQTLVNNPALDTTDQLSLTALAKLAEPPWKMSIISKRLRYLLEWKTSN